MAGWPGRKRRHYHGEERRALLLDHIQAEPGRSFRDLVRLTGIPAGTLRHHLNVLHRHNRIWYRKHHNCLLHFAGPAQFEPAQRLQVATAALDDACRALLSLIAERPGAIQVDILDATPAPRSSTQHRLKRLEADGLLRRLATGANAWTYVPTTTPATFAGA